MRASDEESFQAFFRAEFPRLVNRLAVITGGDRPLAEDTAQEAFVKLYARWRKIAKYENPAGWVCTVATRAALRTMGRRAGATPVNDPLVSIEARLDLRKAIESLSPRQRAAVILHYYDDLPTDQIAEAIGCSTSTVKVHLHNARKMLAVALHEEVPDAPR